MKMFLFIHLVFCMEKTEMSARSVCHLDCLREINKNLHWMCCTAICECLKTQTWASHQPFLVIPFKSSFLLKCYQLRCTLRIFFIKWMGFLCVFCSAVFDAACSGAVDICVFILCYAHLNFMPFTSILSLQSIYKIRNVVVSCICVRCRRIERVWFFVKKFACVARNLHLSILKLWY